MRQFQSLTHELLKHELDFLYFEISRMGRDPGQNIEKILAIEREIILRRVESIAGNSAVAKYLETEPELLARQKWAEGAEQMRAVIGCNMRVREKFSDRLERISALPLPEYNSK